MCIPTHKLRDRRRVWQGELQLDKLRVNSLPKEAGPRLRESCLSLHRGILEMFNAPLLSCSQSLSIIRLSRKNSRLDVRRSGFSSQVCHQQVTFQRSHLCPYLYRFRGGITWENRLAQLWVRILGQHQSLIPILPEELEL